jgi:hypothetical protein
LRTLLKPPIWLGLGLPALAALGTLVLARPECVPIEPEQFRWFWARHYWQCAFDALSAVCGVGLLTHDLEQHYTPAGRWTLWWLGQGGALLFVAAFAQALRGLSPPDGGVRPPAAWAAALAFAVVQAIVVGLFGLAAIFVCPTGTFAQSSYLAGAAFASLGVIPPVDDGGTARMVAAAGLLGGLGWPVWVCVVPALARRWIDRRRLLALAATYGAVLAFAALLTAAIEAPRASPQPGAARGATDERDVVPAMSDAPVMERLSRSLIQCISAATAGVSTEDVHGRHLRDGSKLVVALLILLGGLGGSAGGGVSLMLLAAAIRAPARPPVATTAPAALAAAGRSCVALLVLLALATAFGLLVIEALTASAFQPPPTFADAFLDAASAVGGAHVTSGVAGTVTDPNLTRGLGLGIDQYQYGMVWLMTAMLAGRVLPVWVIQRARRAPRSEPPAR